METRERTSYSYQVSLMLAVKLPVDPLKFSSQKAPLNLISNVHSNVWLTQCMLCVATLDLSLMLSTYETKGITILAVPAMGYVPDFKFKSKAPTMFSKQDNSLLHD